MNSKSIPVLSFFLGSMLFSFGQQNTHFPYVFPSEKPDQPLSAALALNYDNYMGARPEENELYTQFKYTPMKGLDYSNHDGTVSRRDPTKVIFENKSLMDLSFL